MNGNLVSMKLSKVILPIVLATLWISISEFIRNQVLFLNYWQGLYKDLGLEFATKPINGALWGLWSLVFAIIIYFIAQKYTLLQTTALAWVLGFVMMWIVIGNLGVLPVQLLIFAIPLSLLEAFVATWIIKKIQN